MTKTQRHNAVALFGFFLLLVIFGTLNKDQDSIQETIVKYTVETIEIEPLPKFDGTPTLAWSELPMLEELPSTNGIVSPTEDELPHLTLPPLQDF
tara:strand:+ start:164 stop:448 length:285 start_codon:yes stop_codon:yes gene_type:complete